MPNPYYFRSVVNRLWRIANGAHPGDFCFRTADALARELVIGSPRHAAALQRLNAIDAYDYARHLLRDLYDRAAPPVSTSESSLCPPLPLGEGWGEGSLVLTGEEPPDEDDDPL